jgi:uncharacterized protein
VRGKVESFQQIAKTFPEAERRKSTARAERYFQLALSYALCGSGPIVLLVMGRVGSGKSTLARALGRELDWEVFSSDRVRKEIVGVPLHERAGLGTRRRLYSKTMGDRTYAALTRLALDQVRRHRSVILEATFGSQGRWDRIRQILSRPGVGCRFIETQAPTSTVRKRLAARTHATGEISDARLEDLPILDGTYQPPKELTTRELVTMKTACPPEAIVIATLKALAQRCAESSAGSTIRRPP